MAKILCIESATDVCSVALSIDGRVAALVESDAPRLHTRKLTVFVREALEIANVSISDLDAIALSSGPGSYTSLRVGASAVKGLCFALDKPLIVIDTLEALAKAAVKNYPNHKYFVAMIDARRMEVYQAQFNASGETLQPPEATIIDADFLKHQRNSDAKIVLAGNGAPKCQQILPTEYFAFSQIYCSAQHLVSLAEEKWKKNDFEDVAYYKPFYLKSPNITIAKNNSL